MVVSRGEGLLVALLALVAACQRPGASATRPERVELVAAPAGAADVVVRAALARARGEGRRLLVYVSAPWCQPCERFQEAVRAGKLDATFPDLRLLVFDQDRDGDRLTAAGYEGHLVPRFVVPGPDGRGTTRRIEGGTKAADTVATSIAPRLARLLGAAPPR